MLFPTSAQESSRGLPDANDLCLGLQSLSLTGWDRPWSTQDSDSSAQSSTHSVKPSHFSTSALPVSVRGWSQRPFKDGGRVSDGPRASCSCCSHSLPNQCFKEMARSFCVAILGPPRSSQRPLQHRERGQAAPTSCSCE
ncbi:cytoplasmic polyadenylation element binding protein 1 [Homo sapiens]|nr:cytoplasmic polyadenylation element binding protein 1 [Homo sapiens]KAI4059196.1 cytoplasmic polyadenylation element binding protein 1 [Homo sapiens]